MLRLMSEILTCKEFLLITVLATMDGSDPREVLVHHAVDHIVPMLEQGEVAKPRQRDNPTASPGFERSMSLARFECHLLESMRFCISRRERACVILPFSEGLPRSVRVRPFDEHRTGLIAPDSLYISERCSGKLVFESVHIYE